MATMNFSIPDDVKDAFNAAFEGENKSAVVAALMRRAVDERERRRAGDELVALAERIRAAAPACSDDDIRSARHEGRI